MDKDKINVGINSHVANQKAGERIIVSYVDNAKDNMPKHIPLMEALERIKDGASKEYVLKIRELHSRLPDTEEEKSKTKLQSKGIIFQGVFSKRSKVGLITASGLAILDLDHLDYPEATKKMIFSRVDYILAAWISPSGDGVKALARIPLVDSDKNYKLHYNALLEDLERFSVTADPANKDISRLCFESYDPDILIRAWEDTTVFDKKAVMGGNGSPLVEKPGTALVAPTEGVEDDRPVFNSIVLAIEKSGGEYRAGRHEFLMRVVKDCIKLGVAQEATFSLVRENYAGHEGDLSTTEVDRVLQELWRTHYSEEVFGSKKKTQPPATKSKRNPVQRAVEYLDHTMNEGDVLLNTMSRELLIKDGLGINALYIQMKKDGQSININDLTMLLENDYAISYDPITQYFDNLLNKYTLDEVSGSIKNLCCYVSAKDDELFDSMLRKHMIRCVGQGRGELTNRFVFILQQEQQYTGKSEFIRNLNPFRPDFYAETVDDQNSILALAQTFMINLEELEAFTKKDVNTMKALISKGSDQVRKLYTQLRVTYERKASFWGSTNKMEFLDDSSNTRWVILAIDSINFNYNNWHTGERVDIEKVWAEAAHLWKQRAHYEPTADEWKRLGAINKEFTYMNDHDHWVNEYLSPAEEEDAWRATATEIATYLRSQHAGANPQKTGTALHKAGFVQWRKKIKGKNVKGYYVKTKNGGSIGGVRDDDSNYEPVGF